jgi:hypothetical protein
MRESFKPQYQPYNANASELVSALGVAIGLDLKGKAGTKHTTILASFWACVQSAGVGGISVGQVALPVKTVLAFPSIQRQVQAPLKRCAKRCRMLVTSHTSMRFRQAWVASQTLNLP